MLRLFVRPSFNLVMGAAWLIVVVVLLAPYMVRTIGSGQAGVLYHYFTGTRMSGVMDEGFHIIFPADTVYVYDTRTQTLPRTMDVLSFNGLAVTVTVNTRFRVIREELPQLHVEIGPDYVKKLVEPVVLASVREVIGRYRPEELYTTHSTTVQDEVDRVSQAAIAGHHIELMIVVVENMKLPEQVNSAIEEKLQIQQQAQAYEFRLAREAQEAERKRLEAEGQDQYNALLSRSLNPRLLQFLSIDAMRAMATSPNSKVVVVPAGQVPSIPLMLDTNLAPAKEEPAVPPKTVP
ncbi:MAG TPA: prohibitin family protein [Myxococcota bacterium]|nr:prohibitin family protein [Myxococcota bacterium]